MAGRPLRNAMIAVLQDRVNEWFGDKAHTPLEFALEWVENGRTIQQMVFELSREIELAGNRFDLPTPTPTLSRTMLMHYLESLDPQSGSVAIALTRARSIGAHSMVETANVALDADDATKLDRDTLNVLDRRLAAKERLAAAWNRTDFGKQAGVAVSLNFGDLHLAALQAQARVVATIAPTDEQTDVPNVADWQIVEEKDEQDAGEPAGQIATMTEKS